MKVAKTSKYMTVEAIICNINKRDTNVFRSRLSKKQDRGQIDKRFTIENTSASFGDEQTLFFYTCLS